MLDIYLDKIEVLDKFALTLNHVTFAFHNKFVS